MEVVKLTEEHRSLVYDFECDNVVIDNFLKEGNAFDPNEGVTYILLSDDGVLIGYYNIEVGRVDQLEIVNNEKIYRPMGGSVNINYLAIHKNFQHQLLKQIGETKIYLGDFLLRDCEKRIYNLRSNVGISFITLYSTKEGYHMYHDRNDYADFDDDMNTFVQDSDTSSYKLYKCIDDIV